MVSDNTLTHHAQGLPRARALLDASKEVVIPRLLAMLSVLAVFVPSFFMTGVTQALFVPLTLAVGFAMAASYYLSSSLVPVMSTWILREHHGDTADQSRKWTFDRLRENCSAALAKLAALRLVAVVVNALAAVAIIALAGL